MVLEGIYLYHFILWNSYWNMRNIWGFNVKVSYLAHQTCYTDWSWYFTEKCLYVVRESF